MRREYSCGRTLGVSEAKWRWKGSSGHQVGRRENGTWGQTEGNFPVAWEEAVLHRPRGLTPVGDDRTPGESLSLLVCRFLAVWLGQVV